MKPCFNGLKPHDVVIMEPILCLILYMRSLSTKRTKPRNCGHIPKNQKIDRRRDRTCNLLIRSQAPCHWASRPYYNIFSSNCAPLLQPSIHSQTTNQIIAIHLTGKNVPSGGVKLEQESTLFPVSSRFAPAQSYPLLLLLVHSPSGR
jgi:hypothetical protein